MFKQSALLLSAAVLALGVAACGGSSGSSSSSGRGHLRLRSDLLGGGRHRHELGHVKRGGRRRPSSNLAIAANPSGQLAYDKKTLSAKAGKVTITMTNMSSLGHNITIQQGTNGSVLGATPTFTGGTKSVTVNLKAGTYTFFCSVPGHRAGGMVGTLTVS